MGRAADAETERTSWVGNARRWERDKTAAVKKRRPKKRATKGDAAAATRCCLAATEAAAADGAFPKGDRPGLCVASPGITITGPNGSRRSRDAERVDSSLLSLFFCNIQAQILVEKRTDAHRNARCKSAKMPKKRKKEKKNTPQNGRKYTKESLPNHGWLRKECKENKGNRTPQSPSSLAHSFMPVALATRRLWRMLRSSMISSEPPGMA